VSCLSIPHQVSAVLKAQRRRETVGGWADMPDELLAKVLELLEAAGRQEGGLGFPQTSATVRLVCAGWKAVHDALVRRLVGVEMADHRRGRGHAGAALPRGGVAGGLSERACWRTRRC
jgi:hypothetical protein